jgi:uncharacterized membrane protein YdbT with pleckstrin-like domain
LVCLYAALVLDHRVLGIDGRCASTRCRLARFFSLSFLRAWLYTYSTELAVTSKRVIAKFGFIRRNTIELRNDKVESLHIDQGIIGRIFNFGSIVVTGSGGTHAPIPYIANPLKFRSAALTGEG